MIQRIQSVWLLLAAVCAFLSLKVSFYSGNKMINNVKQFEALVANNNNFILMILTVAVAIAALVTIFLYKDRKMQMKIAFVILAIAVINVILFFRAVGLFLPNEGNYDWTAPVVFLIPVFLIFAIRAIYKDEKLVKSVDRLR